MIESIEERVSKLEFKLKHMQLMYKRPGDEVHENITKVLDDIFNKLKYIERRLLSLENTNFSVDK
jgi:hypothetical protein